MITKPALRAYPLSPMQQGMLFHYLKEPHSGVDIEQIVVHLPEAVDSARMEAAWQWLLQRHDLLRARFAWDGADEPEQVIDADVTLPFTVENRRHLAEAERGRVLDRLLRRDRLRGFVLRSAPLLRVTLFDWAESSYSLVFTFHHALIDGRSYPVLLREVFDAYDELRGGSTVPRPDPPDYEAYIRWLKSRDFSAADAFWKELLAGIAAPTPLVIDRGESVGPAVYQHGERWDGLNAETTSRLHAIAAEHGLTTNALVMGAWAILLHRYSGEPDVVFGATRACRKSSVPHADDTVGLFINTVPVRVNFADGASALDVCKAIRAQWTAIRPYEHTPLVRIKSVSRVPASQPLFDSLVVFENRRLDSVMKGLGGAWDDRTVELHELTNFAITLAAYDGDPLTFKIEFDRRRLDEDAIVRTLAHLRTILEGLAAAPRTAVGRLPLMDAAERRLLVDAFNVPDVLPASRSLPLDGAAVLSTAFEACAAASPNARALTFGDRTLTYDQLNAQANRVAWALQACGVGPDTLVGLCIERSAELVVALVGILKSGGAYLPIDLAYPADRVAFMLSDAQAPVLLTQRALQQQLPATDARVLFIDDILARPADPQDRVNPVQTATPDNLAYVIYTSGTTGKPKGSMLTHRNVVRLFSSTEHWYGFNEGDVWTLFHSCAFDFSVWEIWGALLYGGRLVVVPFLVSRSPEAFYGLLADEQVTVLNQTPSAFRQLIHAEESVGRRPLALRYVVFGGEALEMQSLGPWFDRHGDETPRLVNMYGITETTVHVTYRPLSKSDVASGSVIGVPIPDLQIYILDANGEPTPIGVPGEMYVGGAGLARGYLRRPDLTGQRFIANHLGHGGERLYRTGDLARFLPTRDIEYLGRIDHQVKIRGFRIELGEIEAVLSQHPAIREAVVIVREDIPGSKRLVAYVAASQDAIDVTTLREHLKTKLPEYMVPAAFVFLETLPLTTNGKIDRKALPEPEQQRPELARQYTAPRTPVEATLARIWSKALRVDRLGIHDNFFEVGGDSILSIQLISLARREGVELTPKLLFAHQTIAGLAAVVTVKESSKPATAEGVSGDVPLTPIQQWFLEQNLADAAHYNQAFAFDVTERLDRGRLEVALAALHQQHDALRLRFVRKDGGWRQFHASTRARIELRWIDLDGRTGEEQARIIADATAEAHSSFNLERGPVCTAVYFDRGAEHPGRLLLAAHHLVIDGVSWRPFIEDLEAAYRQLSEGTSITLPPKTHAFKTWAERLEGYAKSDRIASELAYWSSVAPRTNSATAPLAAAAASAENLEGATRTITVALTAAETSDLLQRVPAAYNTQINDVLLTAFGRAWQQWTGGAQLFTNLEGHGREPLFDDVDVSRTMGWFTSVFPVRLELPASGATWEGPALKAVKEQLRQVPRRGIGYGVLRYLRADAALAQESEPPVVFNYLGRFDQVVAGSTLFRLTSPSTAGWHSARQRRRHALEVNGMVVDGRLELWWTFNERLESGSTIPSLADDFVVALRQLIVHCTAAKHGYTPSDFPLARVDQTTLDRLSATSEGIEDIYPLSPIQLLFHSAHPGPSLTEFDLWQCTLLGRLNEDAFARAWQATVQHHAILRTTFHGDGTAEPLQVAHRSATLPWRIEDWRGIAEGARDAQWAALLDVERTTQLNLERVPVMRFTLARVAEDRWKFLWCVPALLLDGWSWPLVFADVSRFYRLFADGRDVAVDAAPAYANYLGWLKLQPVDEAQAFWRRTLSGFVKPTTLPLDATGPAATGSRYVRHVIPVSAETTEALQSAGRRLHVTLNTLVQAAWAITLSRYSGENDVLFGAAFAGRPADLAGAESIVGPLVNNVPVRVQIDAAEPTGDFVRRLHRQLLDLNVQQYLPLVEMQRVSDVPWRYRLFDSMIVFQNYTIDESVRHVSESVEAVDFDAPIHTTFPAMLLAEPGSPLRLTIIRDSEAMSGTTADRWAADLAEVVAQLVAHVDEPVDCIQRLVAPMAVAGRKRRAIRADIQNIVPPQTPMEKSIAAVWQRLFGLDAISVEENVFDLGGHSLLMVQMHRQLREALNREFPIVTLFAHPTVRALAAHFSDTPAASDANAQLRDRAERQRQAFAQMRSRVKRGTQ
jgi:amino acid adenylation domain-containing protein/non-ribosomal peptide synthase protein (TIGR01720 family)